MRDSEHIEQACFVSYRHPHSSVIMICANFSILFLHSYSMLCMYAGMSITSDEKIFIRDSAGNLKSPESCDGSLHSGSILSTEF